MSSLDWPFDQAPNVAAISDIAVVENGAPVLLVVHYDYDDSWAFLSGGPFTPEVGRVIQMSEALQRDPTLHSIADLEPGCSARRDAIGADWVRQVDPPDEDEDDDDDDDDEDEDDE